MALSKRIRAFAGVVLFLSVLPAAYLLGELRGAQRATGTTDAPTSTARFEAANALKPTEKLNQHEADPNGTPGQWQVGPGTPVQPLAALAFNTTDAFAQFEADMAAMKQRMDEMAAQTRGVGLQGGLQVMEDAHAYTARCPAEGLEQGSVKVNLEDQQLTVSGKVTTSDSGATFTRAFSHSATLPGPVDAKSLKTDLKDGSLVISVAKSPTNTVRSFSANIGGGQLP